MTSGKIFPRAFTSQKFIVQSKNVFEIFHEQLYRHNLSIALHEHLFVEPIQQFHRSTSRSRHQELRIFGFFSIQRIFIQNSKFHRDIFCDKALGNHPERRNVIGKDFRYQRIASCHIDQLDCTRTIPGHNLYARKERPRSMPFPRNIHFKIFGRKFPFSRRAFFQNFLGKTLCHLLQKIPGFFAKISKRQASI